MSWKRCRALFLKRGAAKAVQTRVDKHASESVRLLELIE